MSTLLITGASGFIGGTLLTNLLNSEKPSIKGLRISALVRGDAQVRKMTELGVNPIKIQDLDDVKVIEKAASEHDIAVHTASGIHTASSLALIRGLAQRKKATGREVHYIHTSGTSNLSDNPISKTFVETREFSDKEDIYTYEQNRQKVSSYIQRTTELAAIDAAVENNLKIYVLMPPTVYGIGTGPFKRNSIQIPGLIKVALDEGRPLVLGKGEGVNGYVHVVDLADLYEIMIDKLINGGDLPSGKQGIYFTTTGRDSWLEISRKIGKAGVSLGLLKSDEPLEISLDEAEQKFGWPAAILEHHLGANSHSKADMARELLGWRPKKTEKDWEESFIADFKEVQESDKSSPFPKDMIKTIREHVSS